MNPTKPRNVVSTTILLTVGIFTSWASAQTCSRLISRPSYGMGIDKDGNVWVSGHTNYTLYKYAPDGQLAGTVSLEEGYANRGVAITPDDNHVWMAHTGDNETDHRISRYANDGTPCEIIELALAGEYGYGPSAIAVDGEGDLWITTMKAEYPAVWRVRPSEAGVDGGCPSAASAAIEYVDRDHLLGD